MEIIDVDKPLYNSRIVDTYIKLIRKDYPHVNVDVVLCHAGMELYQIDDEGHWFSQRQMNRFHEKLQLLTGNREIAQEAGRYAASPEALGAMRKYLIGLVSPSKVYERLSKTVSSFTRSSEYESKVIGKNAVEITVTPNGGVQEELFQCKNRHGFIQALEKFFNCKLREVKHPECMFRGGKVCRYIVSWHESRSSIVKRLRNYVSPLLLAVVIISPFVMPPVEALLHVLPAAVFVVVVMNWYAGYLDVKELWTAVDQLKYSSDDLVDQINLNYENSLMVNKIGQTLSKESDVDGILLNVVEVLKKHLDYDRGLVLLPAPDKSRLIFRAGFGYDDEQLAFLTKTGFNLKKADSKGIFVVSFKEKRPFLLNDIDEISDTLSVKSLEFAKQMGVKSFICCPIVYDNESFGILAVDNIKTKRPLMESDINLLMGVAPQIGISIHNVTLLETKLRQFKSILKVLAATIDARDPITSGHSEKVTEYSLGICHELGMENDFCEVIRVAALLHDYGKIGVQDSVLKKAGRLTVAERAEVETHVVKTRQILERIHFEGNYAEVPEIAGCHHEKLDGSGYPNGLIGNQIPLGAKIIAAADVFEAITSKRHYRDPMPINVAFKTLRMGIGIHFDKVCVEALIRYIKAKMQREGKADINVHPLKKLQEVSSDVFSYQTDKSRITPPVIVAFPGK